MASIDFIQKQNIMMLYELILENEFFINKSPIEVEQFKEFFNKVVPQFYEAEKKNLPDLMSMNRKFLEYIFSVFKKNSSNKNVEEKPLFTIEEIKGKRQSQFEDDLERRQMEFTNAMKLPVPDAPKFSDSLDKPMDEMDVVVKRTIAQRNMEMNKIYTGASNVNKKDVEKWLKPAETSIKPQKQQPMDSSQNIRYIKIDKEIMDNSVIKNEVIDLDERQKLYDKPTINNSKQIKWGKNDIKEYDNTSSNIELNITELNDKSNNSFDIFKKLKKTNVNNTVPLSNEFENPEKTVPPSNNEYSVYIEKRFDEIQEQIKNLNKTLESHMDRCNNTLTILYNLLIKKEQDKTNENVKPENPQSEILLT